MLVHSTQKYYLIILNPMSFFHSKNEFLIFMNNLFFHIYLKDNPKVRKQYLNFEIFSYIYLK